MNHSQRKHLERLLAGIPSSDFDPLSLGAPSMLGGFKVIESPDRPRYTLPAEIMPGVPWPPGFRDEINRWSVGFLGTTNIVPRGTVYMLAGGYAVMRPDSAAMLINCAT